MVSIVNASGNQDIDGILWGWKYDLINISFSFPTGTGEYSSYTQVNGFQGFSAFQANAARQALNNIASFTNLTFTETTASGAQLRFAKASSIDYTDDSTIAQKPAFTIQVAPTTLPKGIRQLLLTARPHLLRPPMPRATCGSIRAATTTRRSRVIRTRPASCMNWGTLWASSTGM